MESEMGKIEDISGKITTAYPSQVSANAPIDANVRSDVQLSLKSFFYTWTVGNFSKCLMFCNPKFYSPEFVFENTIWRLRFHATESNEEKKISIRLVRKEKGNIDFYIKNKVSLIDDEGKILSVNEIESCFQGDTTTSGQISLMLDDSKHLALFNDKLIVHCEFLVLASNVCDYTGIPYKTHGASDFKQAAAVPPPKTVKPLMPSFPQYISRRLNEKGFCNNKEGVLIILLVFLTMQYIFFACEVTMKYEEIHKKSFDAKYLMKNKEMNELIIDSTLKLKSIAEALNLTDVKLKATEVLTSYLRLYNNTNPVLPIISGSQVNASEFFTTNKKSMPDPALPVLKEGKN